MAVFCRFFLTAYFLEPDRSSCMESSKGIFLPLSLILSALSRRVVVPLTRRRIQAINQEIPFIWIAHAHFGAPLDLLRSKVICWRCVPYVRRYQYMIR